ncbi:MAG: phenylalanine--tRNA ligase subunit beta [Candidatus Micrarchaeia archaeon]
MPTSVHNKKYLEKLLGAKVSESRLEKEIDKLGMSIERQDKESIEVEFQANRPDLISTIGLARALRYSMGRKRSFKYITKGDSGIQVNVGEEVEKLRPYIAAMLVKKANFTDESLLDLINFTDKLADTYGRHRKKLAIGLHDMQNVQQPIYYSMYANEEFEPLGGHTQKYSEVLESTEKGKAYAELCTQNGKYCVLKDSKGPMALIPVINSERTKISKSTKELFVDITGTNKYVVEKTANLVAANFIDMGFDVYRVSIAKKGAKSMKTPDMRTMTITLPLEMFKKEIGSFNLAFNNVISLANSMGHEAALVGRNIRFTVPTYRLDIINDQDIIEDIAVAYGYDYIKPFPVISFGEGSLDEQEQKNEELRSIMTGLGFFELLSSYLTNEETNFTKMKQEAINYVKIKNAKASTITMLRTWLLPSLLNSLSKSQHDRLPHKLFELDMAFSVNAGEPIESQHLACVISDSSVDLNDLKAVLETIAEALNASLELKQSENKAFINGRCGEILLNKKSAGFIGEIHPEVLANFGIEEPTIAMEIELPKLADE